MRFVTMSGSCKFEVPVKFKSIDEHENILAKPGRVDRSKNYSSNRKLER